MSYDNYTVYLRKSGRKESVIARYIRFITLFEHYLAENEPKSDLSSVSPQFLTNFVEEYENEKGKSAKSILYALYHYYKSESNDSMMQVARELRAPRKSKRPPFPLKEILGIEPEYIKRLSDTGIKNVEQMRERGKNKAQRATLSIELNIPSEVILELVQISDLVRVGYVKKKFTRLFHNAGIKTPEDLRSWNADELYDYLSKYIAKSGWDGIVPYKSDLKNYIHSARNLPSIVEY